MFLAQLVALVALVASIAFRVSKDDRDPVVRMVSFAAHQAQQHNLTAHDELQLTRFVTFVDSACVSGESIVQVRAALLKQLKSLPLGVRDEIVDMALADGISIETARQNMTNDIAEKGTVDVFMYYINTLYEPHQQYRTCVLASGIRMTIGEIIVGTVTEKREEITGYAPCHCGFVFCEKCPIVSETTVQKPVYARQTGTIDWHTKLQSLLASKAAQQVTGLARVPRGIEPSDLPDGWRAQQPYVASEMTGMPESAIVHDWRQPP